MENTIDITEVNLKKFIKEVYNLSKPQGMGFMHYEEGELHDDIVSTILGQGDEDIAISMDYVNGRSCKMNVFKKDGKLFIRDDWYDHSTEDLRDLLERVGIKNGK